MGFYYPGDGREIPYDEPGKPDRTNMINDLRERAKQQDRAAIDHQKAGYSGASASNRSEARRLREQADNLERIDA